MTDLIRCQWIGSAAAVIAFAGAIYASLASVLLFRFMRRALRENLPSVEMTFGQHGHAFPAIFTGPHEPRGFPAVTLFKPLHFDETGLSENLETFFAQDYPAPVQILFGVQSKSDPAINVVRNLQAKYPCCDTMIVVNSTRHGVNAKVSNLINMYPLSRHDVIVISDSDISVPTHWLRAVTSALERPGVGLVTCLYTGRALAPASQLWPAISAMGMSYEFLPNVVVATSLGLESACLGSTIGLKRNTLEVIGGFHAFADYLADDYEMGRAVRERGYAIAIPRLSVHHSATERSAAEVVRHELRWARTIRAINPAGYLGTLITFGFPFAVSSAILLRLSPLSLWALAATLAARLSLKLTVDRVFRVKAGSFWLLPFRDLLSFVVFHVSLFGRTVYWRGTRFDLTKSKMDVGARDVVDVGHRHKSPQLREI